jgi:hypothetical protein
MKRDKELIKAILIFSEEYHGSGAPVITPLDLPELFHHVTLKDFNKHGQLIIDHGLAKGSVLPKGVVISSITWDGYEFLDNARECQVWNAAKKAAGHLSWNVFINVLTETATNYAKSLLSGNS